MTSLLGRFCLLSEDNYADVVGRLAGEFTDIAYLRLRWKRTEQLLSECPRKDPSVDDARMRATGTDSTSATFLSAGRTGLGSFIRD
jgi:hypothetical protein